MRRRSRGSEHPVVQGGLIHFTTFGRSAAVTFRNAFGDWHCHVLAMESRPGTLSAFVSRAGDDVLPRSGDVIHVTKAASVQFAAPMLFRVIRVHDWPTYEGWIWLDGYELNASGDAVERRSIFVQVGGLRAVGKAPDPRARNGRQPGIGSVAARMRALRANR